MNADEVEFLSSGQGGAQGEPTDADAPPERGAAAAPAPDPESGMTEVDPEDLPF